MSTITILQSHEGANPPRLVRFLPVFVGKEREIRHISMVTSIHAWLHQPAKTQRIQQLKAAARVHLGEFVKENAVDDCRYMKQVEDRRGGPKFGHGVWSVRPRFEPQHRFFGVFACPNWFLIFNKQARSRLVNDVRWHAELDKSLAVWNAMFPAWNVYTGTELRHYVTHNASHCDERWYPIHQNPTGSSS
jgi:hypothetical protein